MMGYCVRTAAGRKGTAFAGKKEGKKLEYNYMLGIEENFHCKKWPNFANFFFNKLSMVPLCTPFVIIESLLFVWCFFFPLKLFAFFFSNIKLFIKHCI